METYIQSIHIKQFKCALQHYWFQVYSCLFWLASTMIAHSWKDMVGSSTRLDHTRVTVNHEDDDGCLSDHEDGDEEYDDDDEEEEYISEDDDDETIVTTTTTVAPWSKEIRSNEETSTLHSFDTTISSHQSESKSFMMKRKALNNLKTQMAAWKQKHFQKTDTRRASTQETSSSSSTSSSPTPTHNGFIKLFSKKHSIEQRPRISLATFRRKTSPSIY